MARFYSVVVSISGCDPLDPGSNPGRAILLFGFVFILKAHQKCASRGIRTPALKEHQNLSLAP